MGGETGFGLGMYLFSEYLKSSHSPRWRIGNEIDKCNLCGKCESVCPVDAIKVSIPKKTWTLNNRRCSQCLTCAMKCPARCLDQVRV